MKKQVSATQHGIMDYAFAFGLLTLPSIFGINHDAVKLYRGFAINVAAFNAVSDHGVAVKPIVPMTEHRTFDIANLGWLYNLILAKPIRGDKKAMRFHLALTAMATVNIFLTDYSGGKETDIV